MRCYKKFRVLCNFIYAFYGSLVHPALRYQGCKRKKREMFDMIRRIGSCLQSLISWTYTSHSGYESSKRKVPPSSLPSTEKEVFLVCNIFFWVTIIFRHFDKSCAVFYTLKTKQKISDRSKKYFSKKSFSKTVVA